MNKKFYKYLLILLLTFSFTYIFELKEFYMLLYILFFIPILDIVSLKIFVSKVTGDIVISNTNYTKEDVINFHIYVVNKSNFHINNISINIMFEGCISEEKNSIDNISLIRKNSITFKQDKIANHIGVGIIKLDSIRINGLFGFFESNIIINKKKIIKINPRVLDIIGYDKFIYNIDYREGHSIRNKEFVGELDVEYKNYELGEPVNKINWKISSKKQTLLMRKDIQNYKRDKIILILDTYVSEENLYYDERDKLIEGFLGIVNKFYNDKFEVQVYLYSSKGCEVMDIDSDRKFEKLKKSFVNYYYKEQYNIFETLKLNSYDGNYVIVTSSINNETKLIFNNLVRSISKENICIICTNKCTEKQNISDFFDIYYMDDRNIIRSFFHNRVS